MIEGRNIYMSYRRKTVLNDVSLCINRGEIIGIAGPNGVGKTTLIRILSGITLPKSGKVIGDNDRIYGMIEQPAFYSDMTGRQNVEYYLDRMLTESEISNAPFGITEYLDMTIKKYSMGMKQKLALWLVSLADADIVLLDEPTVSLDVDSIAEMEKLLMRMKVDKGILISSHDLRELQYACDRVLILKNGGIVNEIKTDKEDYTVRICLVGTITEAIYALVEKKGYSMKNNEIEASGDDEEISETIAEIVKAGGKICEVAKSQSYLEKSYQAVIHGISNEELTKGVNNET